MTSFRFSPNPNQAHQIDWHPWGEAAFAKAQAENKPVLLAISAVWCYWCHIMDETSYSDPDVLRIVNEHFIAVRVDNDHRPDINVRYNVGGWPTTAFLTGHGGLIGGATYLPADQLLAMLAELQRAYQEDKPQLYEQARNRLRQRKEQASRVKAGPEVAGSLVDRAARTVAGAYDAVNGGFGEEPKFPNGSILSFLLHLARTSEEEFYRAMLRKTLDRMSEGDIFDREAGGFFRHSANSDWSEPQLEKILEENIILAQVYMDAWLLLQEEKYKLVATQTLDYMMGQLFDQRAPGFHGSQGAHSEYFSLPMSSRGQQASPAVDPFCYVSSNAQAVTLMLEAAWKLDRPELEPLALKLLEAIDSVAQEGHLSHVYAEAGPTDEPAFLADWAHLLSALLSAHGHTAQQDYLDRAIAVALVLVDRFFDQEHGGFFDIEQDPTAIGHLQVREKPFVDNLMAALALLKLHHVTRNEDYRQLVEATLSAFVDSYRDHGEFAATYGLAIALWQSSPVEITIEGCPGDESTLAMLQATAKLNYPHLEIRPALVNGHSSPARALICLDTICLPPVSEPDELADALNSMVSAQANPFENILERFPGI